MSSTVTEKILLWSESLPSWQRDALRRLAADESLSAEDVESLLQLLKHEHGLAGPGSPTAKSDPLNAFHLPISSDEADNLRLTAIRGIRNVNRLQTDQALEFAPEGLTLIYAPNAGGKSGYTRILKRASRSRGREGRILGDAFSPEFPNLDPASAVIDAIDSDSIPIQFDWCDSEPSPDQLTQVRVFDSKAAAVYIGKESELAFIPFNLDLLQRLGELCSEISEKLKKEIQLLKERRDVFVTSLAGAPAAQTYAAAITASTSAEELESASTWNEAAANRLSEVRGLVEDPSASAAVLRRRASRLRSLSALVEEGVQALGKDGIAHLSQLRADRDTKKEAADALSRSSFEEEPLQGVGGGPWRVLWEAARKYSEEIAYPSKRFPVTDDPDSRCVLCQQALAPEAASRLRRFDEFVENDVAQLLKSAETVLAEARAKIDQLPDELSEERRNVLAELKEEDADLAESLATAFQDLFKYRAETLKKLGSGEPVVAWDAPRRSARALKRAQQATETAAVNAEQALEKDKQEELQKELDDLLRRKAIHESRDIIEKVWELARKTADFKSCRHALNTQAITNKKKELESEFITEPFRSALKEELAALGVKHHVTLEFRGEHAVTYQRAQFADSNLRDLASVLSEGEHRAVALACFLAELRQLPGNAPLVVDDPVSSLDHARRRLVARRLVEEAKGRQVIVFTHDLVFYTEILGLAAEQQVSTKKQALESRGGACGIPSETGEPWQAMDVKTRLHLLEAGRLPELRASYDANDPNYRARARSFGQALRETWERLVEEALLAKVIVRFSAEVQTLRLREVHVEDEQWRTVHFGMKRVSRWAHDEAAGANDPPPTPDELKAEIGQLREAARAIKKTRKETGERRRQLLEAPTS